MHLNGKISKMQLNGGKLAGSMQMDRIFMFMKKTASGGCLPLPRGYIHVYLSSYTFFFSIQFNSLFRKPYSLLESTIHISC